MKWIVKIIDTRTGSCRHKVYKTERGARKAVDKILFSDESMYIKAELYHQIPVSFAQLQLNLDDAGTKERIFCIREDLPW